MEPRAILITGGSSGIGAALALLYAGKGVSLFLSGRSDDRLAAVAEECRKRGADARWEAIDVADRAAMAQWITAADTVAPLDLVIANAGISGGTAGATESEAQARQIFAINVDGVLNTVHPTIALMSARKTGQIALMSSLAGFLPLPGAPAYAAGKAAVRQYGEALRPTMAREGLRISVICPGFVESRMTAANPFPMPFLMPAERAARIIRSGLQRDRARIAFPWQSYVAARCLGTVLPTRLLLAWLAGLPSKQATR